MNPMDKQLAYNVTRWQRFLYEDEKFQNKNLQDRELAGMQTVSADYGVFQKEVFARLYSDDLEKLDAPVDWAEKLHSQLDESKEFQSISSRCKGDEIWSGIACSTLSKHLSANMQESNTKNVENAKRDVEEAKDLVEGLRELKAKGANVEKRLLKAKLKLSRAEKNLKNMDSGINLPAIQRAIRKACDSINIELNETEQLIDSMVYDSSKGTVKGGSGNQKQKRELAAKLQANPKLKEVAKIAGRLRRIAAEKQRSKTTNAASEIKNIQQGNSVDRLLPSELVGLVEPAYEALFYSKLLERQLLQYELEGKEVEGQGPIIICIDESGSMRGLRDVWAKAVALAMLDIARKQNRAFVTVHFSNGVGDEHAVNMKSEITPELIESIVDSFAGGGTDFEPPLRRALTLIQTAKKADVVFITDGACEVSESFLNDWKAQKQEKEFSLYSIAINCHDTRTLDAISDKVFNLDDMLQNADMESTLFSI